MARTAAERHQHREGASSQVECRFEHRLEAPAAGMERRDTNRLGGLDLSERRRGRRAVPLVRRSKGPDGALEGSAWWWKPQGDETEHVVAVTRDRRRSRLRDDRD